MRIVISPSGNLYGSENVLFDYLENSKLKINLVYVPNLSPFQNKLQKKGFTTKGFSNVKLLYIRLFSLLCLRKINTVYCNEAGHVKYIAVLARFFTKVNFLVHIRILEDSRRINYDLVNLEFIAISKTILRDLPTKTKIIYDGYSFDSISPFSVDMPDVLRIGIVGRFTQSKGVDIFTHDFINQCGSKIEFHFFGDIDKKLLKTTNYKSLLARTNVFFHGFIKEKNSIYVEINLLLHVNENEPLGRIFFESLDYGIPFIGLNSGGIAEIAEMIHYPYIFSKLDLAKALNGLSTQEWNFDRLKLELSRKEALDVFSIVNYSKQIDQLLIE